VRLAYADPPYPGQAKRHYGDHPDYAGEVNHRNLLDDLCANYDGWALSTSNQALPLILHWCLARGPVRTLAWCKPIAPPFPGRGVYGWEPVVVHWARPPASDLRDTITVSRVVSDAWATFDAALTLDESGESGLRLVGGSA
jgi:hypothetical protein